jgi:hypothetical protein
MPQTIIKDGMMFGPAQSGAAFQSLLKKALGLK